MNPSDPQHRPEFEQAWERRLDAELRALPEREAPSSLVPNVMAMIAAREALRARAWWRRPATTWHPALRVVFATIAIAALGGLMVGAHILWPELLQTSAAQTLSSFAAKLGALWDTMRSLIDTVSETGRALLTPTRLAILGAIVVSQVLLLGAGGAALRASLLPRHSP